MYMYIHVQCHVLYVCSCTYMYSENSNNEVTKRQATSSFPSNALPIGVVHVKPLRDNGQESCPQCVRCSRISLY